MATSSFYHRLLASIPAFAGLDRAQLQTLYGFCSLKVLAKGETAAVAGAVIDELAIIVSGRVAELTRRPARQELGRDEAIEARAFFTQRPASATYAALRETVLLTLSWDDFMAASRASPGLLGSCVLRMCGHKEPFAPVSSGPARLVICPAGAEGRLHAGVKDALLSGLEALAEVRVLARGSFGGEKPGAITLNAPETAHWLQQQELEFDLTVVIADAQDPDFTKQSIEEADEILFVASGGGASLSALERFTLDARDEERCRLVVLKGQGTPNEKAREWTKPRPYRTTQSLDLASPQALRLTCSAILGKGNAIAATSSGVYAAAILGALQAFEARGLPPVSLAAAGSAVMPAGLLALGASLSDIEAVFRELANPLRWKHATRTDTGLFDPRPIDNFLAAALPALDLSLAQRPFTAITASLSTGVAEVHRDGRLQGPIRAGLAPIGILPPLILDDGTILNSGEDETEALFMAAKTLTAAPVFFLYPKLPPLGLSATPYRRVTGAAPLRLTPFQSQPALDKRVRLETILGLGRGAPSPQPSPGGEKGRSSLQDRTRHRSFSPSGEGQDEGGLSQHRSRSAFAIPIPDGVMPMDWAAWATLRDASFKWTSVELDRRQLIPGEGAEPVLTPNPGPPAKGGGTH
jgi:hypothetical protein